MFLLTAFGTYIAYDPPLHVGARHLGSGCLRQPYFPEVLLPIWKAWNNEADCTIVGEKLSYSPTSLMRSFPVKGRCIQPDFTGISRNGKSMNTLLRVLFPGNVRDLCLLPISRNMLLLSPISIWHIRWPVLLSLLLLLLHRRCTIIF